MVFPLVESPLGGNLGAFTCSVYKLDQFGIVPLEPLLDIIPGVSPMRVTFDMVDNEQGIYDYDVVEHPIQDLIDVTTHVHRRLERITVTGTMSGMGPLGLIPPPPVTPPVITPPPLPLGIQAPSLGSVSRLDLIRVRNLKRMAATRSPVMVVTPRLGLARAFITSITPGWAPDDGESSILTVSFKELRFVTAIMGELAADYAEQTPGNNVASGGGQAATTASGESATASGVTGVPPTGGP
jgi:hypothetical protein